MVEQYAAEYITILCRRLPGVDSYYPFGPQPECFRVGGKIFADIPRWRQRGTDHSAGRPGYPPRANPAHGHSAVRTQFWKLYAAAISEQPYEQGAKG